MSYVLALAVLDRDLTSLHVLAATRDRRAVRAFTKAVLKLQQRAADTAMTPEERNLAQLRLQQLRQRLEAVLGDEALGGRESR